MSFLQHNNDQPLSRVIAACQTLSILCKWVFAVLILWSVIAIALMTYSIFSSPLPPNVLPLAIAILILYALYSANSCLLPWVFVKMLGDISESKTPFTLRNAGLLRLLAIILLVYLVLETLLAAIGSQFAFSIESASIQVGSMIRDFLSNSGTTLNLFPLLMAAMFFALSYVFKYGVLLQQESDETL